MRRRVLCGGIPLRAEFGLQGVGVRSQSGGVGAVGRGRGGAFGDRAVQHGGLLVCAEADEKIDDMADGDPLLGPVARLAQVVDGLAEKRSGAGRVAVSGV